MEGFGKFISRRILIEIQGNFLFSRYQMVSRYRGPTVFQKSKKTLFKIISDLKQCISNVLFKRIFEQHC